MGGGRSTSKHVPVYINYTLANNKFSKASDVLEADDKANIMYLEATFHTLL